MSPDSPMRILHFIDSGGLYGAEKVLLNLSRQMAGSGRFHPVVGCIVSSPQEKSELFEKARDLNLEAVRVVIRNGWLPYDLVKAGLQIQRLRIDLIHSHGYKPSVWGFLFKPWSRIPIMATCHLWFKGTGLPFKMRAMLAVEKIVYRYYQDVVGVSQPICEILAQTGVQRNHIHAIENGVDTEDLPRCSTEELALLRHSLGIPLDSILVLNAARVNHQKGQWNIVKAARLLRAQPENFRFLIVGEGPLEGELKSLAQAEGVEDRLVFGGFRDDVDHILQTSDVFVLPSVDEGMPMSLLEAIARSIPVVTTAVGDISLIVEHEKSGLIIPQEDPQALADAILAIIRRREKGAAMAAEALRMVARQYSSAAMFAKYAQIYGRYATK